MGVSRKGTRFCCDLNSLSALRPNTPRLLLLLGDDLVLDLVVSGLRKNFLRHQIRLLRIRPPVDDLLRIDCPNSWQRIKLILGRRIDIEQVRLGGRGRRRGLGRSLGGLCDRHSADQAQREKDHKNLAYKPSRHKFLLLSLYFLGVISTLRAVEARHPHSAATLSRLPYRDRESTRLYSRHLLI